MSGFFLLLYVRGPVLSFSCLVVVLVFVVNGRFYCSVAVGIMFACGLCHDPLTSRFDPIFRRDVQKYLT